MTNEELKIAGEYLRELEEEMNGLEYKSGRWMAIRDKFEYFLEFMELFGYGINDLL